MNPSRLVQKLTDEIVNKFRLPKNICYAFIKKRITWAFVAGWELGKKRTGKRAKAVLQLDKYGKILGIYAGYREAAKTIDVHKSSIGDVVTGRRHSCKGYYWRAIDDEEAEKILEKWQEEL
jgi:hypothetical protein